MCSMNNLQEQGRACYKRREYEKAIDLFDRAIGRAPSVQLLDNRAACYEKLEDYSTALKDAKKAIQLHREDAVGYLRAGRLLLKMEKPSVALEIYTHGLKCIKHVGQGYEQLRKVHKELMDQLCPPKSVDPLTMLPRELAETILEYLSFRQRMNACLVSKGWSQFIYASPSLWRHFDLSGARRKVRTAFVSRAINTARKKLRIATLSNLYDFDKTLRALAMHCQLEDLTLLDCAPQGQSLGANLAGAKHLRALKISEGSMLNSHELHPLLSTLSAHLETLDCSLASRQRPIKYHGHCPKLKSLTLTINDYLDHQFLFQDLAQHYPVLQKLIVRQNNGSFSFQVIDLRHCQELRHVGLHMRVPHVHDLQLPTSVTTFEIDAGFSSNPELPLLDKLSTRAQPSFIRTLALLEATAQTEKGTESRPISLLREMSVTHTTCRPVDFEWLMQSPRLRALETLSLSECVGVDDTCMSTVAALKKFPQLRAIDLTATDITGVGVKDLVEHLCLDTLILNDCRNVSPDAVEWARSKGVTVKYRMTSSNTTSGGGRRVRY